jgi:catechol 2,3-dioxygenase-like lactoylglutathione lyase family enzyme
MTQTTTDLGGTVTAMRPFVPAKDFAVSTRFYGDLGFRIEPIGEKMAELYLGNYSFLLQDYYVKGRADNFMMHMLVDDLDRWWQHIVPLDLAARHGVQAPRPPKREPWGLDVIYVFDPAGVLWHIAQLSETRAA